MALGPTSTGSVKGSVSATGTMAMLLSDKNAPFSSRHAPEIAAGFRGHAMRVHDALGAGPFRSAHASAPPSSPTASTRRRVNN